MGWSIGYDDNWQRDIGYGVPAWCDHPDCREQIDRGLAFVCGGDPYGGEHGCGLFFCEKHLTYKVIGGDEEDGEACQACERCSSGMEPFSPKDDHIDWLRHKLTDDSWHQWRAKHPKTVKAYKAILALHDGLRDSSGEARPPHG